jgi:hypothetical protein
MLRAVVSIVLEVEGGASASKAVVRVLSMRPLKLRAVVFNFCIWQTTSDGGNVIESDSGA